MNHEEYPSDSDASDEDFRPDIVESDSDSILDEEDKDPPLGESTGDTKGCKRKRKLPTDGVKKKCKASKVNPLEAVREDVEDSKELDEEEEKRRTDALWADFLGGSSSNAKETKATDAVGASKSATSKSQTVAAKNAESAAFCKKTADNKSPTVEQIFEFAGERVEVPHEESRAQEKDSASSISPPPKTTKGLPLRGTGLASVLNVIGKKNKLSTLEKTKLDWNRFKRHEGIDEELQTHNKGKDGFLERRDFLERTDVRQFEIEKSFRQTKRSNR
ncbi:craniofacial development protein 1 [Anopheles cruzii]|uniref:craniofacial development protein 1 n=1 Tax=Anopheles cruzii TaxID=68878 RepID=UPI0022EC6A51|nr:craniofacial development protein 1 [Anopheles cruzii]